MKKVLIEVGHPNDVHQFKYLYEELIKIGWQVLFMAKKKDIVIDLLDAYKIPYFVFGSTKTSRLLKMLTLPIFILRYFFKAWQFKPDFILSRNTPHSAYAAKLLGVPNFGFADTEISGIVDTLSLKYIDAFFTSTSFTKKLGKNHFQYTGYIESWYLNPLRYKPNTNVLNDLGVKKDEIFSILRFVSWNAHHDVGIQGLSDEFKIRLVNKLLQFGKVFISSENQLPSELEKYKFRIAPEKMHDALNFASFFYGESATMASECACLGTPAFYLDRSGRGYTDEQESKYGLVRNFSLSNEDVEISLTEIDALFQNGNTKENWENRNKKLLKDTTDMVLYIKWFLENYPKSLELTAKEPAYYQNFLINCEYQK
jgi:predicted glycosyltransferase